MKITWIGLVAVACFVTGCVKSMASDKESLDVFSFHDRKHGASARELLSDERFHFLEVELQYMKGYKPEKETLKSLEVFLNTYLRKPGGITIVQKEVGASGLPALSKDQVLSFERSHRTAYAGGNKIAIYVLFTDGTHPDNRILGMAYRNTSAVIFGKSIRNNSNLSGKLTRSELQTAVLLHEIGHLLGLVSRQDEKLAGSKDEAMINHCTNTKCLMYYTTETRKLSSVLLKGKIPELDTACINLLKANGGKDGFYLE